MAFPEELIDGRDNPRGNTEQDDQVKRSGGRAGRHQLMTLLDANRPQCGARCYFDR